MQTMLERWYQGQTLIFGHRGASAYAPMNTLPAFELAAAQGADGVELDVWLSKDRLPVIIHDETLDGTTDGSGYVWDFTAADLQTLDASHKFAAQYRGARIPTLDQVFESVGQRLIVNVEIKSASEMPLGVEQVVAETIRRHNMAERVIISSFSAQTLKNFRAVMPAVPLGFLREPGESDDERDLTVEALHPHFTEIDAAYMEQARRRSYRVNTWTVNDATVGRALRALGVDGIITDAPDVLIEALRG